METESRVRPGKLVVLPCTDSAEPTSLPGNHRGDPYTAASLAHSAVQAIDRGSYTAPSGRVVAWSEAIKAACAAKVSIPPWNVLPPRTPPAFTETQVQVTNEPTLRAVRRLTDLGLRPLALNFANSFVPGGGFLEGANAQEEGLCRLSALYATLKGDAMYVHHQKCPLPDATDWAILSPNVPVFRDDHGTELEVPWLANFLTCAAPVAHAMDPGVAADLLRGRIHRVLEIAVAHGYEALVLGAWGCGAFGNDPRRTATDFRAALDGKFAGAFSRVDFAILDRSSTRRSLGPFRDVFAA